jgi:long-chain-fatty-acid--CoA ligase ACSBG
MSNYVTVPDGYLEPKIAASGFAAEPAKTVVEVFEATVQKHGSRPALALKRPVGGKVPDAWKFWTWKEYHNDCRRFAKTLLHLGLEKWAVVNILGFNSPEWLIANCGSQFAACIAAGIYATNTAEACLYITQHSKAGVVCMEDNKQLAKYAESSTKSPSLKAIAVWGNEPIDQEVAKKTGVPVYSWEDFLNLGSEVSDSAAADRVAAVRPGNCSTLIYTSGTTGPPKAVMISHDNVTWTTLNMCTNYVEINHEDRLVSYLPLSHIAAQLIDIHVPVIKGACTYFCQPDALKGTLTVTMRDVRPTIFFGVPRVWEKIQERIVGMGRDIKGLKKTISTWAKSVCLERNKSLQYGETVKMPWGYGCSSSILAKVTEALGLDQCKGSFTAAAPIAPETLFYFASINIPIFEVFGQSECTGPHTVSWKGEWKIGTCGRPMPGTESMIVPSTGELSYRGRHIFMGYMYDEAKTAETIDSEGYLHSGDVAEFDSNNKPGVTGPSGFMRITGRIKELIITAGGENIPPVLIENEMKCAMLAISNVVVIGDKRKYLSMVVSLKSEVDLETMTPTDKLAADSLFVASQIGSSATTVTEAAKCPAWKKYLDDGMKAANLKTTSNAQIVQKWALLPRDFSEKTGELTPTMKLKRNVVAEKYAALIDSIYANDA